MTSEDTEDTSEDIVYQVKRIIANPDDDMEPLVELVKLQLNDAGGTTNPARPDKAPTTETEQNREHQHRKIQIEITQAAQPAKLSSFLSADKAVRLRLAIYVGAYVFIWTLLSL